jgi:tetratricopeptide (TPR) repeat protein
LFIFARFLGAGILFTDPKPCFLTNERNKMARRKKNKKAEETLVDIIEVRDQAQNFFERNQTVVLGVLTVAVLLVGGIFAYNNFYKAPKAQEATEQMMQAQYQFERDSFALALTNPGGGAYGFLDIIDSYGGTPQANLAKYYAGVCYLNIGEYEAAIDLLKSYSPDGQITPIMRNGAIGDAYSELSDYDSAISYYERAINAGDNSVLTTYYLKKLGMLYERNGEFAEAKEAYERIKNEYPNTVDASQIDKYIARVSNK